MDFLIKYGYNSVIFIYSYDAEGRAMLGSFQSAANDHDIEVGNRSLSVISLIKR